MFNIYKLSDLLSKNRLWISLPKIIYFLFFAATSAIVATLTYLPLFIFYTITLLFTQERNSVISQIPDFLIYSAIPVILSFLSYRLIWVVKKVNKYFIYAFFLTLTSFFFYFQYCLLKVDLAVLILLYVVLLGIILTYFWKRIVLQNKTSEAFLLIFPISVTMVFFLEATEIAFSGNSWLLQTYSSLKTKCQVL